MSFALKAIFVANVRRLLGIPEGESGVSVVMKKAGGPWKGHSGALWYGTTERIGVSRRHPRQQGQESALPWWLDAARCPTSQG